ncbi:MAG TPA: VTT domain-containing protein [Ginsengibacter sp.]|nr:VTT domain-containing protein [Chitinophagaceae bacterium]MCZ2395629.1 VTT domain-containing protein [Chitinophagales bacterium]HRN73783.1 VTT domain-containing protein [Ginsengibacter sp.]MCO5285935.1 VTT domain-containing protein [Chitinophagaceae bacterium]MCW5913623.1 VTT domain-containing protein [Chitinophagaceae bacterium]
MDVILEFLKNLTDPQWIVDHGGLFFVLFIIFAESGLFFGFFLPGDSLLFIAGMVLANSLYPFDNAIVNLIFWIITIGLGGIIGNYVGYWFGKKSGDFLLQRKDTFFFKKKHIYQAKEFYDKKGGVAIILARFIPIVRTFVPIVAGLVKMEFKKFSLYNIVGGFLWTSLIITVGYLLGENVWVKENLEKILIGIILISVAPVFFKIIQSKFKKQPATP